MIVVYYSSDILGNGEFWRGDESEVNDIRNIPARRLAQQVRADGATRASGMWTVRQIPTYHDAS